MSIDRSWPLCAASHASPNERSHRRTPGSRKRASHRRRSLAPRAETHFWEGGPREMRRAFSCFRGRRFGSERPLCPALHLERQHWRNAVFPVFVPESLLLLLSGFAHDHLSTAALALLSACQFTDARPQI
ncbi:hypothetical protein MTO96_020629 [Rhipicephalus appendiculatus]